MKPLDEVYIYALLDPREGIPRYIGKTLAPEQRFSEHLSLSETKDKNSAKGQWIASLLIKGYRPVMVLLDRVKRTDEVQAEKQWIAHFEKLGVNLVNTIKK